MDHFIDTKIPKFSIFVDKNSQNDQTPFPKVGRKTPGTLRLDIPWTSLYYLTQSSIQSGLNISESVILTNSNNDTCLVGTNFFSVILIRYSGKFLFRLRHNKTGNQMCYFLYNQYPLHWHLVKNESLLRKLHCLIALLYFISALDCKVWLSVGRYEKVRQRCSVSVYTS